MLPDLQSLLMQRAQGGSSPLPASMPMGNTGFGGGIGAMGGSMPMSLPPSQPSGNSDGMRAPDDAGLSLPPMRMPPGGPMSTSNGGFGAGVFGSGIGQMGGVIGGMLQKQVPMGSGSMPQRMPTPMTETGGFTGGIGLHGGMGGIMPAQQQPDGVGDFGQRNGNMSGAMGGGMHNGFANKHRYIKSNSNNGE